MYGHNKKKSRKKKIHSEKKITAVHQKEWVSAEKKKYSRKKKYRCPAKGVSEWLYYLFQGKKYETFGWTFLET